MVLGGHEVRDAKVFFFEEAAHRLLVSQAGKRFTATNATRHQQQAQALAGCRGPPQSGLRYNPFKAGAHFSRGTLVKLIPCVPQHAALARSLSDSNPTFSRLRQPPIRSSVLRRRVRDRLQSLATTRPLRLSVASPDLAALARGLSPSIQTLRAQQRPVRHLVLLHTSQFLHTLDAFPSDQGRLRLLVWIIGTRKGVIRDF
ncbi:hypothetical protein EDB83DRAFT_2676907 [Lactarius deliciosus]|nr:hypothetical protein EDB83DRAFT_2676907 [Lactarius deliciosus]